MAVGVRLVQPVELGERDRLDDGEAPLGAVIEVALGLLAGQAVEQLPRRVAQPEERPAVGVTRKRLLSETRRRGVAGAALSRGAGGVRRRPRGGRRTRERPIGVA